MNYASKCYLAYLNGGAAESTSNAPSSSSTVGPTPLVVAPVPPPPKPAPLLRMATGMELTSRTLLHGTFTISLLIIHVLKSNLYAMSICQSQCR